MLGNRLEKIVTRISSRLLNSRITDSGEEFGRMFFSSCYGADYPNGVIADSIRRSLNFAREQTKNVKRVIGQFEDYTSEKVLDEFELLYDSFATALNVLHEEIGKTLSKIEIIPLFLIPPESIMGKKDEYLMRTNLKVRLMLDGRGYKVNGNQISKGGLVIASVENDGMEMARIYRDGHYDLERTLKKVGYTPYRPNTPQSLLQH